MWIGAAAHLRPPVPVSPICPPPSPSSGWVAVTAAVGDQVLLRVLGPPAVGIGVRTPAVLPHVVTLKGERIRKSAAYKPTKPPGLLDGGLSARADQRLQLKKKK